MKLWERQEESRGLIHYTRCMEPDDPAGTEDTVPVVCSTGDRGEPGEDQAEPSDMDISSLDQAARHWPGQPSRYPPMNYWTVDDLGDFALEWEYPAECLPDGYEVDLAATSNLDASLLNIVLDDLNQLGSRGAAGRLHKVLLEGAGGTRWNLPVKTHNYIISR